jgi:DNA-binding NarL/FixJ family response regulator
MTRKVLIVDDHAVVREGIKKLLEQQPIAFSCGEAGTPDDALRLALLRVGRRDPGSFARRPKRTGNSGS